jgi:hypothetical protein
LLQAFPKKWWAESDFTDDIGHTFWGVSHNSWPIIVRKVTLSLRYELC